MLPTATAVEEQSRAADVALLPVGAFEQHGGHLPLSTDSMIAGIIAERLAGEYGLLELPPVSIGCSHEHEGLLGGTVSISARTLYAIVTDVAASLERSGIRKLVVISGHGGNYVLSNVVQEANVLERRMSLYPGRDASNQSRADAECQTTGHEDMHGGEWETSILLHAAPEGIRDEWKHSDNEAAYRPDLLTLGTAAYTTNGVIGRPSLASARKGKAILDSLATSFAQHLAMLRG